MKIYQIKIKEKLLMFNKHQHWMIMKKILKKKIFSKTIVIIIKIKIKLKQIIIIIIKNLMQL